MTTRRGENRLRTIVEASGPDRDISGARFRPRPIWSRPSSPTLDARLALEATGKPIFVNLTADWCVTRLINERDGFDSASVRQAFAARGIIALKGDRTNRTPEIIALPQQYGRSGAPLYLPYDGKSGP